MTIHQNVANNNIEAVRAELEEFRNFQASLESSSFINRTWIKNFRNRTNPANELERIENYNATPLFVARTAEMAQLLIDYGADVNYTIPAFSKLLPSRMSILNLMIMSNENNTNIDVIKVLLNNNANIDGKLMLMKSIFHAKTSKIIQLLIDAGANVNESNVFRTALERNIGNTELSNEAYIENICIFIENGAILQENYLAKLKDETQRRFEQDYDIIFKDRINEARLKYDLKENSQKIYFLRAINPIMNKTCKNIYEQFYEIYNIPTDILNIIISHISGPSKTENGETRIINISLSDDIKQKQIRHIKSVEFENMLKKLEQIIGFYNHEIIEIKNKKYLKALNIFETREREIIKTKDNSLNIEEFINGVSMGSYPFLKHVFLPRTNETGIFKKSFSHIVHFGLGFYDVNRFDHNSIILIGESIKFIAPLNNLRKNGFNEENKELLTKATGKTIEELARIYINQFFAYHTGEALGQASTAIGLPPILGQISGCVIGSYLSNTTISKIKSYANSVAPKVSSFAEKLKPSIICASDKTKEEKSL